MPLTAHSETNATAGNSRADLARLVSTAESGGPVPVIVVLDEPVSAPGLLDDGALAAQQARVTRRTDSVLGRLTAGSVVALKRYTYLPAFAAQMDATALSALAGVPGVAAVVEDGVREPLLSVSTRTVQADRVRAAGVGGAGQTVVIVDSGVDGTHPALVGRVVSEACFSSNVGGAAASLCPGGASSSTAPGSAAPCNFGREAGCGHGTAMAGIAAGRDGVAPDAHIIAIQAGHRRFAGCGGEPVPCLRFYDSDIAAALDHVEALSRNNPGVGAIAAVNLSVGSGRYSSRCDIESMLYWISMVMLRGEGIATVAPTGNNGFTDAMSLPACISAAVSVGATWSRDWPGSLWQHPGGGTNRHPLMSMLLAPGAWIEAPFPGNRYEEVAGTSAAAAHVTGAFALMQGVAALRGRRARLGDIEIRLEGTGHWIPDPGPEGMWPEIRILSAAALLDAGGIAPPAPPARISWTRRERDVDFSWTWSYLRLGGTPTDLRLSASLTPGGPPIAILAIPADADSYTVSDVPPGTYYLRMAAGNSGGWSPLSREFMFEMPLLAPGPPAMNEAVVTGRAVTLSWRVGSTGGLPTSYLVGASSASGGPLVALLPAGGQSLTVPNAPPGRYYVRVAGVNAAGTGPASNEIVVDVP